MIVNDGVHRTSAKFNKNIFRNKIPGRYSSTIISSTPFIKT